MREDEGRRRAGAQYASVRTMIEESYLPQALQIGIDYELFWRLTPKKMIPFIKAYEQAVKEQLERSNYGAWFNGVYTAYAVASILNENTEYPSSPMPLFETEETIAKRQEAESQRFSAFAAVFNKAMDEKREDHENG